MRRRPGLPLLAASAGAFAARGARAQSQIDAKLLYYKEDGGRTQVVNPLVDVHEDLGDAWGTLDLLLAFDTISGASPTGGYPSLDVTTSASGHTSAAGSLPARLLQRPAQVRRPRLGPEVRRRDNYADKDGLFTQVVVEVIAYADAFARGLREDFAVRITADNLPVMLDDIARRMALAVVRAEVVALRRLLIGESRTFPALARHYFDRAPGHVIEALAADQLAQARLLRVPDSRVAAAQFAYLVAGEPLDRAMLVGTVFRSRSTSSPAHVKASRPSWPATRRLSDGTPDIGEKSARGFAESGHDIGRRVTRASASCARRRPHRLLKRCRVIASIPIPCPSSSGSPSPTSWSRPNAASSGCLLGPNLTALGIGSIIGTGIFVLTGKTAASLHAGPALVLSMILAASACAFADSATPNSRR